MGQLNAATIAKFGGTTIPTTAMDPNMLALMKLYPAPNVNPNSTGGYNWADDVTFSQPNQQWDSRVDYNISDNTKLFVRYNLQRETQLFPVGLWWHPVRSGSLSDPDRRARTARTPYRRPSLTSSAPP